MNRIRTISAVLRSAWALEPRFIESHLALVARMLSGEPVSFGAPSVEKQSRISWENRGKGEEESEEYFMYAAYESKGHVKKGRWNSFDDAPEGAVAVIPVTGPVMKYGGDCGEPGSIHMSEWIKQANRSSKISGIVLEMDTPGGMVDGTASLADEIKASKKPVVAIVNDGMMASAGVWIGVSAQEVYATRKTDFIGSIGVLATIADYRGYLEKMGVKLHEIYAPQSSDKNRDYKDALEGDYTLVQAELKLIADEFIKHVKSSRKGKLNLEDENPFTGKMYPADEAIKLGLIDGYKSFEQAVIRAAELANA